MIQVTGLTKTYGEQVIFENISFTVNQGERIGIVGKNGHGKSTLFRIILQDEMPDSGTLYIPEDYSLGHLSQHLHFQKQTVLEEGCSCLESSDRDQSYRVKTILHGLGFADEDFQKSPMNLSGGFQVRLNLAKLLITQPRMLLLDEPTNYLDIVSLRWLSRFLQNWRDELMIITHDSEFMDAVTTHTLGIHRKKIKKIAGPTKKYYEQIALEEEIHEQSRLNQEGKRKEVEEFIERFRAKASKARAVQSRVKALEKMGQIEKLETINSLDFSFRALPFSGRWLLEVENLSFAFKESEPLIQNLTFSVSKHDRIAVIGKNGKGKTTLLNLLAGELTPKSGTIKSSSNLKFSYFGQTNVSRLDENNTVEDEILSVQPEHNRTIARSICGAMMFEGDLALKKVKVLSGGEKSRTLLGKVLTTPSNLLLLDEPTNHLDLQSTNAFRKAVKNFPGAVIMVTHSEVMLHELATRLIVYDGGKTAMFEGSYQDFLTRIGWQDELEEEIAKPKEGSSVNKKELRKIRADIITRRSKALTPLKQEISELESEIMKLEPLIEEETKALIEISKEGFGEEASKLSRSIHANKTRIEELFSELEDLSSKQQVLQEQFEKELAALS